MSQNGTRSCLFKLMEKNFVYIQEIPKTEQRTSKSTIHLFGINLVNVKASVCREMYKTVLNLLVKYDHQKEENKLLIDKYDLLKEEDNLSELTEIENQKLNYFSKIEKTVIPLICRITENIYNFSFY